MNGMDGGVVGATARDAELSLSVRKVRGFVSGRRIQGQFQLSVESPHALSAVVYRIGDHVLGRVEGSPYELRMKTDVVPMGTYVLSAEARTRSGKILLAEKTVEVVDSEFVTRWVAKAVGGPVLTAVAISMFLVLLLAARRKKVRAALGDDSPDYGYFGGAVCPSCGVAFAMHWWAPHAGTQKYDRCPSCRKWSKVSQATPGELRAAEARARGGTMSVRPHQATRADDDRKALHDSRFVD